MYSANELQKQYLSKYADVTFCPHFADVALCYSLLSLSQV